MKKNVAEKEQKGQEKEDETPPLFEMKKQRTLWWTIIKLIAPTDEMGKIWNSHDALGAWCTHCKVRIQFSIGNVNSVKRHIMEFHPQLNEPANGQHKDKRDDSLLPKKRANTIDFKDRNVKPLSSSPKSCVSEGADFSHLLPPSWKKHIQLWIEDDIPSYDVGGFVVGGKRVCKPCICHVYAFVQSRTSWPFC
jgi:hypothetical protein